MVVEEVRKLAEESAAAASEITELIGGMRRSVQETVVKSEDSSSKGCPRPRCGCGKRPDVRGKCSR